MVHQHDVDGQVWRAAILTVALAACFVFGAVVLASGDWLPGGIIVAASAVGLVREVRTIRSVCSTTYSPSPPKHGATK